MEIEDDEVGQLLLGRQRLGRLAVVVGTLERTSAVPLLAHLARDVAVAAGDGLELRQVAVDHFHRLVAVVDDE